MAAQVGAKIQLEVSAKTGDKVEKLFNDVARELCKIDATLNKRSASMMLKGDDKKKKSGGCCGGSKKDKK